MYKTCTQFMQQCTRKSINVTALYKIIFFTILCVFFVHFIYFNQFLIIILCVCVYAVQNVRISKILLFFKKSLLLKAAFI